MAARFRRGPRDRRQDHRDQQLSTDIVGVADATFHGTTVVYDVEVYIPVTMAPALGFNFGSRETTASGILSDRRASFTFPQGFLRPGATIASASAQSDALWAAQAGERRLLTSRSA